MLVGCVTTSSSVNVSYDEDSRRTVYETAEFDLDGVDLVSGITESVELYARVRGECIGKDCTPGTYTLIFGKEGRKPVRIEGRNVSLSVGSETITWEDPQNRRTDQRIEIRSGSFARVDVSSQQLSTLASVSQVEGAIGGTRFRMSYEERAPLRELLGRLQRSDTTSVE